MKKLLFFAITPIAIIIILNGCVRLNTINKPISISDLQGTWEGIQLGYCFLDITENRKGYLVFTLGEKAQEVHEIMDISFAESLFTISLKKYGQQGDLTKIKGKLFGKNILILSETEDESLYFLRESIVPDLRKISKEKIQEIKDKNT